MGIICQGLSVSTLSQQRTLEGIDNWEEGEVYDRDCYKTDATINLTEEESVGSDARLDMPPLLRKSRSRAEFPASTKNSNTHCAGCVKC